MAKSGLSKRIRPNCEAAAWVCEEVQELEAALDAAVARAEQAEAERDTARWEPLEDYHKRHVPGCRKHMYDRKSSPCSCVVEYDRERVRADANERWANEKIAALAAAQAEREALDNELTLAREAGEAATGPIEGTLSSVVMALRHSREACIVERDDAQAALTEARRVLRLCSEWLEPEVSRGPANERWVAMMRDVAAVLAQERE